MSSFARRRDDYYQALAADNTMHTRATRKALEDAKEALRQSPEAAAERRRVRPVRTDAR